jgi:peroxiredoxin
MNKFWILLTLISILLNSLATASEIEIKCDIKLNGNIRPDTIYVAFFTTTGIADGQKYPEPFKMILAQGLSTTFSIDPGIYSIGVMAIGYKTLKTILYVPDSLQEYKMTILLNPQILGWGGISRIEDITEVSLRGDFNRYLKTNEIPFSKEGNIWKPSESTELLKPGMRYAFYVNGQETLDLTNKSVYPLPVWMTLKNVFHNNPLKFDPSLYALEYKESEMHVSWNDLNQKFLSYLSKLNHFQELTEKMIHEMAVSKAFEGSLDSMFSELSYLEKECDPEFHQLYIDRHISACQLKFTLLGLSATSKDEDQTGPYLSDECISLFEKLHFLVIQLDPNTCLVNPERIFSGFIFLHNLLEECPELTEKFNLQEDHYSRLLDDFISRSDNNRLKYNLLFLKARYFALDDENEARRLIGRIRELDYKDYIEEEELTRFLARFDITLGKQAPDFTLQLLDGKTIQLSSYKGKYVYIDFWGTWCQPCLAEIPHLTKFYRSVSHEKLEIIGVAQDKETSLREFVKVQEIEYPNGVSTPSILAQYNITRFPTSFLVNPKGIIVRIDLRGDAALTMIVEEIENYFK